MEKIYYFFIVLVLLVCLPGCRNINTAELAGDDTFMVITASQEDFGATSKTIYQPDRSMLWGVGEEISLFCGPGTEGGN